MTVIVGLIDGERVVMGADTCVASDGLMVPCSGKLIRRSAWLFGIAGSAHINQFLHTAKLPDKASTEAVYDLAERWWSWCRVHDRIEEGRLPGSALIASDCGQLWRLQNDGSVLEVHEYATLGAGEDVALGALVALTGRVISGDFWRLPEGLERSHRFVEAAVEVAIQHHPFCGGEAEVVIWPPVE